ncbi:MAG: CDGSH iron-sulfur domain-containing protein [Verrucomicrobia bacterium]|nr:MAG: CDGSH iron-sulfur domain-containing protein [Verrucomicrobiota bacterium]
MNKPHVFQKAPLVQEAEAGVYWFCTCGRSQTQPVCDGSHKGTGFAPLKVELKERRRVAWCGCKHSQELPWCDGSHAALP